MDLEEKQKQVDLLAARLKRVIDFEMHIQEKDPNPFSPIFTAIRIGAIKAKYMKIVSTKTN